MHATHHRLASAANLRVRALGSDASPSASSVAGAGSSSLAATSLYLDVRCRSRGIDAIEVGVARALYILIHDLQTSDLSRTNERANMRLCRPL